MGATVKKSSSQAFIRDYFAASIMAKVAVMETLAPDIEKAGKLVANAMQKGGKWLLFGNGGSAADAQHLAAELVGRLYKLERRGLPAIALTTDSSALTCVGNDYGYENIFERQIEALAKKGDIAFGISTSGNSPNVIKALKLAKKMGCVTIALTGNGGALAKKGAVDLCLSVPAPQTSHVQESHIAIGHVICFIVEQQLVASKFIKARQ